MKQVQHFTVIVMEQGIRADSTK